jgi:organic hydroperoxide reductase OsmC/OhrA
MQAYPHQYSVAATGSPEGEVLLASPRLSELTTAPPAEFGGPGDLWSPETLCVGAVADCFILTFRAVARASKFEWSRLRCDVRGTLDRVERVAQFTTFQLIVALELPVGGDVEQGRRLLARAEQGCLITNSMKGNAQLEATVEARS